MRRRLPVFIFAAAMAIWGMASIPDGSGADKTLPAYRRGELARPPDRALPTPMQKAATSALRGPPFDSCGAAAGGRECLRVSLGERSWQ
jgi:hypothetical protein